jgi:type IV secretion system protein VirB1
MDLLTALLTCNLHTSDPELVRAITANSHANPHFVVDVSEDVPIDAASSEPKTDAEAIARVHDIDAHGGKPLLGLLQIPAAWLTHFGRELADAFDPCVNIAIGSAMLSAFEYDCAHKRAQQPRTFSTPAPAFPPGAHLLSPRRLCVVRAYADAIGERDFEEAITLELSTPSSHRLIPAPADAPIFPSTPGRSWGPDCLLVPWLVAPATSAAPASPTSRQPTP